MLRVVKSRKGQAVIGEYAVVISMVLAVIVAMTVYFKRAVQARIHGARDYMVNEVLTRTEGQYNGPIYSGYEPYYTQTNSVVSRTADDETRILPTGIGTSGAFEKDYDETVSTSTQSETLPPSYFNATTPPEVERQ